MIDELVEPNHLLHAYPEDFEYGSGGQGFKRLVSANHGWFRDWKLTIEDLIAEGDIHAK